MKKNLLIMLLITIAFTCNDVKQNTQIFRTWNEQEIRKYFMDSIAYRPYNGRYGEGSGSE